MTFATCLNCIDGRVQLPAINWITEKYNVKYVDMITKAGMNGFLAAENSNIHEIIKNVEILKNSQNFWELEKAVKNFVFDASKIYDFRLLCFF